MLLSTLVRRAAWLAVVALAAGLVIAVPGAGTGTDWVPPDRALKRISPGPSFRYYVSRLKRAPAPFRERLRAAMQAAALAGQPGSNSATSPSYPFRVGGHGVFNNDVFGLPQNEESISACRRDIRLVLGGTNDYRGLLDPEGNFTGWHFSNDAATTLANEGLLPPADGIPSGGDPVDDFDDACFTYASSLNYSPADPFDPTPGANGIGMYKSDPTTLATCPGGSDPSCWPNDRLVATNEAAHFLDKEWFDVGVSGAAGNVVWVTYSDFDLAAANPAGFTAEIFAVRCDANLVTCTSPIPISEDDEDVQFSHVTIGPDGRVYVTWSEIEGEIEGEPQTFIHKIRVAQPGSTVFGPERVIYVEERAIPFGGFLHANDFRIATYMKNDVALVGGRPRVFVIWDACAVRVFDNICEEPEIKLMWSDDQGATWNPSSPQVISYTGDNYFPTISVDRATWRVATAWFTNRYDNIFHNMQDVDIAGFAAASPTSVNGPRKVTRFSNESEADPLLGGFFIGDYIQAFAHANQTYLHWNANYRQVKLVGMGFPIPQQDNVVAKHSVP